MKTSALQEFAVAPPTAHAWLFIGALGVLPLAIGGTLLLTQPDVGAELREAWPALAILPLVLAGLALMMRRRRVELRGGTLEVRAAMYRKRVAAGELDLERARTVDLAERTDLRPLVKTNGMSMPGFHAGHFRLREGLGKAFCLLTDRSRVLWLPLRDGKGQLLLSLERPQALLDALRAR